MRDDTRHTQWVFDRNADDIRGWPVRDNIGMIGTVGELLVDTESEFVTEVVLTDGRRFLAHDVQMGDRELLITRARGAAAAPRPDLASTPRPAIAPNAEPATPKAEVVRPSLEIVPGPGATIEKVPAAKTQVAETVRDSDDVVLQLIDEELEIGMRRYEAGGIHLETHIVTEPIAKEVRIHEERVKVERNKLDRALDAAAAERSFHDETVEIKAKAEVPLICKSAHVVEEIVVKKKVFDRSETVRDKVRHMDVDITELRVDEALQGGHR